MKQKTESAYNESGGLPRGAMLLQGQYEILQHIATGGFGMTYLARDSLSRNVVVKECFPEGLCIREGRLVLPSQEANQSSYQKIVWNFVAEARRLAKLKHPNIVAVHQVFEENHTAYMAMDFVEGEELLEILETAPRRLTSSLLQRCLREVLAAVSHLHETGILHRDISPDNLILGPDGHVTLIDFGAARERSQQSPSALTFLLAVKDGYSPYEFYVDNAPQNASSDLYSLAVTFYHLITGAAPPDCWTRHQEIEAGHRDPYVPLVGGDWDFDEPFLALIDRALSVLAEDRIKTAADWLEWLDFEDEVEGEDEEDEAPIVVRNAAHHAAVAPVAPRRAGPPPVAEVDLQALSRLVQDTNTGLAEKPKPVRKKTREEIESEQRAAARQKQLVDIYGEPVEDIDTWMKEQERVLKAKAKREAITAAAMDENRPERRKSLLLRLLTGKLGLARDSATPV